LQNHIFTEIPAKGRIFIVSMVANYGAGEKIKNFQAGRGYAEGKDFIMMAKPGAAILIAFFYADRNDITRKKRFIFFYS